MNTFLPLPAAIDAILFDLDGTVIDTIPHILASFRHATADVLGESLPDDELMHHVGIPLETQMRYFTTDEDTVDRLLASYREFNHRSHDEAIRLYPNTMSTLQVIHGADVPMGIVTSKGRIMAERAITLFGLGQYFGAIITADDTPTHKPDPLPVVMGAEALGILPSRCVYVGDSPMDIEAGNGAGAYTIAATWGVASSERLEAVSPDAVIDDIAELPSLLGIGS
ncbi:MAG: HAD-IA family hydrolase [Coriobacteriia bacterium]|nr:HAD-IA family hydrolase [Coriobacteriia bacterium]